MQRFTRKVSVTEGVTLLSASHLKAQGKTTVRLKEEYFLNLLAKIGSNKTWLVPGSLNHQEKKKKRKERKA